MRTSGLVATAAAAWLVGINPGARAEDYPDLEGTWRGTSEALVLGSSTQASGDSSGPQSVKIEFTLTLDHQDGPRIWGKLKSSLGSEPFLAVVDGSGRSFLGAGSEGHFAGTIRDPNTLEICYARSGDALVASCTVFHRQ